MRGERARAEPTNTCLNVVWPAVTGGGGEPGLGARGVNDPAALQAPIPIVGGTGALGSGLALRLAGAGCRVVIGSRDTGCAEEAAGRLRERVAIGAFATSEIIFIKELGVGTALAVIIDATLIRALLVPSLMALLGGANWWAPDSLRRLHRRAGLTESPQG